MREEQMGKEQKIEPITERQRNLIIASSIATTILAIDRINVFDVLDKQYRENFGNMLEDIKETDGDVLSVQAIELFKEYMDKIIKPELVTYHVEFYFGTNYPEKLIGVAPEVISVTVPKGSSVNEIIRAGLTAKGTYPKTYSVGNITEDK